MLSRRGFARSVAWLSIGVGGRARAADLLSYAPVAKTHVGGAMSIAELCGWRIGDKTGSGGRSASNDVAVAWPPNRSPLVIAAYLADTEAVDAVKNAAHAAVGRAVAEVLGG